MSPTPDGDPPRKRAGRLVCRHASRGGRDAASRSSNNDLNRAASSNTSVTGSACACAARAAASSPAAAPDPFRSSPGRGRRVGLFAQRRRLGARVAMVVGESFASRRPRRQPRPEWRKISPDRRCRQRRARGAPASAAMKPLSGPSSPARPECRARAPSPRRAAAAYRRSDHDQRMGARELRIERRAQRTGGNDACRCRRRAARRRPAPRNPWRATDSESRRP